MIVSRLQLLGGAKGLLDLMMEEGVKPDIKTLSILLQIQNSRYSCTGISSDIGPFSHLYLIQNSLFFHLSAVKIQVEKKKRTFSL
jgi:pentatricopeptide repeat protein